MPMLDYHPSSPSRGHRLKGKGRGKGKGKGAANARFIRTGNSSSSTAIPGDDDSDREVRFRQNLARMMAAEGLIRGSTATQVVTTTSFTTTAPGTAIAINASESSAMIWYVMIDVTILTLFIATVMLSYKLFQSRRISVGSQTDEPVYSESCTLHVTGQGHCYHRHHCRYVTHATLRGSISAKKPCSCCCKDITDYLEGP